MAIDPCNVSVFYGRFKCRIRPMNTSINWIVLDAKIEMDIEINVKDGKKEE